MDRDLHRLGMRQATVPAALSVGNSKVVRERVALRSHAVPSVHPAQESCLVPSPVCRVAWSPREDFDASVRRPARF